MLKKNHDKFGYKYWNDLKRKSFEKSKAKVVDFKAKAKAWFVAQNKIKKKSFEKSKAINAGFKARLKVWFDYWIVNCHTRCENCGAPINLNDRDELYACQAHILPKAQFKDVADEINNHMTLGAVNCSCHSKFDLSWYSAQQMEIFPIAWIRVQTFLDKITDPVQRRKIPDCFMHKPAVKLLAAFLLTSFFTFGQGAKKPAQTGKPKSHTETQAAPRSASHGPDSIVVYGAWKTDTAQIRITQYYEDKSEGWINGFLLTKYFYPDGGQPLKFGEAYFDEKWKQVTDFIKDYKAMQWKK